MYLQNRTVFVHVLIDILVATNGVSVLMCLLAAILVFVLKLHKKVVYRLALYQVFASLSFAMSQIVQVIYNYVSYNRLCIAFGWLGLYTEWVKLLFTMWVTFHLFCFAILHKNLQKLEVFYVATSLLVPAMIACVPLMSNAYGPSPLGMCYVYTYTILTAAKILHSLKGLLSGMVQQ